MMAVIINLTIDGMAAEAPEGSSILEVINAAGVYVPQLCKDPAMPAIGACRTCLVQVEGRRGFPASCHTPVSEGMVVHTNSPEVRRIRQGILDLTLGMLPTETRGQPLAEHKELKTASKFHDLLSPGYEPRDPRPHRRQQSHSSRSRWTIASCAAAASRRARACRRSGLSPSWAGGRTHS